MTSLKDKYPNDRCFLLRLPPEIHEQAIRAAQKDRRSLNNWIVGVIMRALHESAPLGLTE